jgi:acyl carrier protein
MSDARQHVERTVAERELLLSKVRTILVEALHVQSAPADIEPDVALFGTGLGLDSVDAVELLVSLETSLGVHIPDQGMVRRYMRTVNTLVDLVLECGAPADG